MRRATAWVLARARHVRVDRAAAERVAEHLSQSTPAATPFDDGLHYVGPPDQTANYVLLLDALNFCFWGDDEKRWRVEWQGQVYNGYRALAAALRRQIAAGVPVWDATLLARLSLADLRTWLRGVDAIELPLLASRWRHAQEVGAWLLARSGGRFLRAVETCRGSAVVLVHLIESNLPSFADVALYAGQPVGFYKRAQICVADLHAALGGQDPAAFRDLASLTAFADYKVPQILRALGILEYSPTLAARVDGLEEIPAGSPEEVEIRAGTIWGVEALVNALHRLGRPVIAQEVDYLLWEMSQGEVEGMRPYHRTRTGFY